MAEVISFRPSWLVLLASIMLFWSAFADCASLSSVWHQELPNAVVPEAFLKLASPLSVSDSQAMSAQIREGTFQASKNQKFCSSAGIYCAEKATVFPITNPQPRVCIPPFFLYAYAVLPCRQSAASVTAMQASGIFMSPRSLSVGSKVLLPDTSNDLGALRFLPNSVVHALPRFDTSSSQYLTSFYGVDEGSEMKQEMENTLAHCSFKSSHEVTACLASGEDIIHFVSQTIGRSAAAYTSPAVARQKATVTKIAILSSEGDKTISCHDMKFPSLLYSCHMTQSARLMDVSVQLANGQIVHVPAVCHMDTSYWNPSHIAFQVLNVQPGKSSVCHWFPENAFMFVQNARD